MLAAGCPDVGREMLATGLSNDCFLLVSLESCTCWFLARRQNAVLSADCDDIIADVIIADPLSRFMSTADGDDITTDDIISAHSFLQ
ncbi:hypothetical protein F511_32260 [Dorcoceras hygrometricum]|uniref:Uncharacterized protein n=1 Tax=Dorcoceras hygrometricum TaxID=472368 RepID=A0A2Z7CGQ5_9LAMI|nr:hypothetical protein F511_32260 [Dorcoceras hygrometricum]